MQYVIMDLEWNNTYARKKKGFLNEIIEIGAVKLDSELNQIDTFSQVIRSQIGKKLRGSVKKLTNITNEDVKSGELFTKTFSEFKKWLGKDESTVLTWGDGDIRVLIENYNYLNGIKTIPFLDKYCDLQSVYHKATGTGGSNQAGLHTAAESLGIDPEKYALHRALGDSLLTAEIFKKIFNEELVAAYSTDCDEAFYEKLFFKAKVISNIDNPLIDRSKLSYRCESCGRECVVNGSWKFHNQFFRAVCYCPDCKTHYKVGVRFKKYYDRVEVKKTASAFDPELKKREKRKSQENEKAGEQK